MRLLLHLFFLSIAVLGLLQPCQAQLVQVIDQNSRQSIPGVVIINAAKTRGIQTDAQGKADLSAFGEKGPLSFRHPGYLERSLSLENIRKGNYLVELTENIVQIPEVVVSANRWEQKQEELPNQLLAVSAREIAFQNPATTADLLQQTGEVFVQKSQLGGGSPMLRGFAANSVLLVVDGIRMNNALYRSGNLQNIINLDAAILEGAEVIFGPGSVIYGSDALGGVMDFHTKSPLLTTQEKIRIEGSALLRGASATNEKTAHADLSLGSRKFASLSSITLSDFDDLRAGQRGIEDYPDYLKRTDYIARQDGEDVVVKNPAPEKQLGSGYSQLNVLQKFRWVPSPFLDVLYSFHYTTSSNIPRYDRLVQRSNARGRSGSLRFAEWYYGPQDWMLHSLQLNLDQERRFYQQGRITAGYQRYKESRHSRRLGASQRENQFEQANVLTLNADFTRPFSLGPQLFYGAEGAFNWITSDAHTFNIETGDTAPSAARYGDKGNTTQALAAYASLKYPLGPKLLLNAGGRYTWYQLSSQFSNLFWNFPFKEITLQTSALNGNLGVVYKPAPYKISFLLSSGFRAPNVDDISKVFDPAPSTLTVPNPQLQPEFSYNAELTTAFEGTQVRLSITNYLTLLDKAIVRRPFTLNGQDSLVHQGERKQLQALINTGSALLAGSSLVLRYSPLKQLLFSSSLTYSWGEDLDTREPLRHNPPLFGQSAFRYQQKKWSAELGISYNGAIKFENLAAEEQDKAYLYPEEGSRAWWIADLKGSWKPLKELEINLGVENLLDTYYRTYSSGISAPGRNVYMSLRTYF